MKQKKLMAILTAALMAMSIMASAQTSPMAEPSETTSGTITVTVDSIDVDMGYIMITIMSQDFHPLDYSMRPAQRGSMTFELKRPALGVPFSVMVFHDLNMNGNLDLNEQSVPVEKCAAVQCVGTETTVHAQLRFLDKLLKEKAARNAAAAKDKDSKPTK